MLLADVDEHRTLITGVTNLAETDLAGYVTSIIGESPEKVAAQVRPAATAVISQYGEVAAVSGALFYETNRPRPGYVAPLVGASIGEELVAALGWALTPLFKPDLFTPEDAVSRLQGVVQQYVANADRATIIEAARRDPLKASTVRYARVGACAFCAMMSAQTVTGSGRWHDHCHCVEVPSWDAAPAPESALRDLHREQYEAARKALIDAQRSHPDYARLSHRRFLRRHPELSVNNKNLARVMREMFGFAH